NCTFTKNFAKNRGGGAVFVGSGNVYLRNCILYDNNATYFYVSEIHHYPPHANVNLQNCIVKGSVGSLNWNSQFYENDLGNNIDVNSRIAGTVRSVFSLMDCNPTVDA